MSSQHLPFIFFHLYINVQDRNEYSFWTEGETDWGRAKWLAQGHQLGRHGHSQTPTLRPSCSAAPRSLSLHAHSKHKPWEQAVRSRTVYVVTAWRKKPVKCDQNSLGPLSIFTHTCGPHLSLMAEPSQAPFSGRVRAFQGRTNPEHTGPGPLSEKQPKSLLFLTETSEEVVRILQNDFHLPRAHKHCISLLRCLLFHIFTPHKSRWVLQSMTCHHSLIRRVFFLIICGPENNRAACNGWYLRVRELWDINTEIQDINPEMDIQSEAGD